MKTDKRIWLITGTSAGLGEALAHAVIESGDFVIGTFRHKTQIETFNNLYKNKAVGILLEVSNAADIQNALDFVKSEFGRIDILVNNAGSGFVGAIEETSRQESRNVFDVNFFGVLEMTNIFLPLFRKQKSGHIFQISSHGGIKAFAGFGMYNASKFALEGLSEALALEVAPLGIKVTIVEPGPFRTSFAGQNLQMARKTISDYNATAGAFREQIKSVHGKQEGDPKKAARAIIQISNATAPPLRLPLGKIALKSIQTKMESIQHDLQAHSKLAENTVFE